MSNLPRSLLALVLFAAVASAQVGSVLPDPKLSDFTQTKAKRWQDFSGRVVLLEFFAFW